MKLEKYINCVKLLSSCAAKLPTIKRNIKRMVFQQKFDISGCFCVFHFIIYFELMLRTCLMTKRKNSDWENRSVSMTVISSQFSSHTTHFFVIKLGILNALLHAPKKVFKRNFTRCIGDNTFCSFWSKDASEPRTLNSL